jgi:hemerythrin-like metal-binding protein
MNPLYIVWKNDQHSVGVPILDEQHHSLVATINSLYYFIQEGWGLSALKPTVKILITYSQFHQKTEEGMLTSLGYPAVIHHIESQEKFEKNITESMEESLLYADPNILLKFLRTWLTSHLQEEHVKYTPFFDKLK